MYFSEVFRGSLGDPLGGKFSSRRLSVLLPLFVLPLRLRPTKGTNANLRFSGSACSFDDDWELRAGEGFQGGLSGVTCEERGPVSDPLRAGAPGNRSCAFGV